TGAAVAGQQLRRFNLAPKKRAEGCKDMLGQPGVLLSVVLPAVTSAWLLSAVVTQAHAQFSAPGFKQTVFFEVAGLFLLCHTVVAIGGQYLKCFLDQGVSGRPSAWTRMLLTLWGVFIIALAGVLGSIAGAGLVVLVGTLTERLSLSTMLMSWHWV